MKVRIFMVLGAGGEMYAASWSGADEASQKEHVEEMFYMNHDKYKGPLKHVWIEVDVEPPAEEVVPGQVKEAEGGA